MPIRLATIRTKHLYVTNGGGGARLEYATPISFLCSYQGGRNRAFQSLKATISKQNHFSSIQAPFVLVAPCPVHRKNVESYDSAVTWILVPFSGEASRRSASGLASRSAGSASCCATALHNSLVPGFLSRGIACASRKCAGTGQS
jgi:hypothetical protein